MQTIPLGLYPLMQPMIQYNKRRTHHSAYSQWQSRLTARSSLLNGADLMCDIHQKGDVH